jgi:hypothetical protein
MTNADLLLQRFVDDLFTNGAGEKADRLVLYRDDAAHDLGGLNRQAVMSRLRAAFVANVRRAGRRVIPSAEKGHA